MIEVDSGLRGRNNMITRKEVEFEGKKVKVYDFSLMKTHEALKVIGELLNKEDTDIEDELQYILDLHAMQQYLKGA